MESIKIDRVLELVAGKVLERTKEMPSLAEKQVLVEKIKDEILWDSTRNMISCSNSLEHKFIQREIPIFNYLVLERSFSTGSEDEEEDDLHSWVLWCFDTFDELRGWFRSGVEGHLDIAYIDSVYAFESWTYREVPVRYFLTVEGEKHYISTLDFWEDEDAEVYRNLDIELAGVAEAHCSAGTRCHIGFTLADIYNSIIFNELADFTHPTADTLDAGYFFYEGEKHYFLLHTKEGRGWVDFVTPEPECKRVEINKGFWRTKDTTEDEVLKNLQN